MSDWDAYEHARTTDPSTSHAAAASIEDSAQSIQNRIFQLLYARREPMAVEEVAAITGLQKDQVWRRMSDLKNARRVEDSGLRHTNENGRKAIKWMIRRTEFALSGE